MPAVQLHGDSTIHYTDLQPSGTAARTLVFIHGLGSSQNFFLPAVQSLRDDYRCILLDTPGSARSSLPAEPLSVQSLAQRVVEFLEHLGVSGKVVVVGHSMGCLVALHVAQQRPALVEGLVLMGPVYPSPAVADAFQKRIETVKQGGMETMANSIPASAPGARASALQRAFIRELLLGQTAAGYMALCRAIATAELGDLAKVAARALIVAGAEDKSAPVEGCEKICAALGERARMRVVEGVGHWHVVEAGEEMARLVSGFCGELA